MKGKFFHAVFSATNSPKAWFWSGIEYVTFIWNELNLLGLGVVGKRQMCLRTETYTIWNWMIEWLNFPHT